jgi:hypothetical protein
MTSRNKMEELYRQHRENDLQYSWNAPDFHVMMQMFSVELAPGVVAVCSWAKFFKLLVDVSRWTIRREEGKNYYHSNWKLGQEVYVVPVPHYDHQKLITSQFLLKVIEEAKLLIRPRAEDVDWYSAPRNRQAWVNKQRPYSYRFMDQYKENR